MDAKLESISEIRSRRRESFENHQLENQYDTGRGISDYLGELHTFRGNTFTQWLGEKLRTDENVSILDIGCGQGVLLTELAERYPTLEVSGITAHD